jgi:hypothetical protein
MRTPGPWTWFDYPDGRKLLTAPNRAVIHCPDAPIGCDAEDAALIAAAPELLQALKDVMRCFEDGSFVRNTDSDGCSDWAMKAAAPLAALGRARVAIARAEATQPDAEPKP